MVMSQGTYTFLACFAGFWLAWALVVMLCCFCSSMQRRIKRRRQARSRERCLRTLETEPLGGRAYPQPAGNYPPGELPRPPLGPLSLNPNAWNSTQETDAFGKPPCYEEAVLMEDPPPPYSEVLAGPRSGSCTKPASGTSRQQADTKPSKAGPEAGLEAGPVEVGPVGVGLGAELPERPFSSLIRLPVDGHWDSLGRLLSAMDLNRNNLPHGSSPGHAPALLHPPRGGRTNSERGLDPACPLPTAFPLFGRSTAV